VVAWMALIFALSSLHKVPHPPSLRGDSVNVIGHFGAYGVLAILTAWALAAAAARPAVRVAAVLVVVLLYGISDEFHQSFVPGRRSDPKDVMVDVAGATCALLVLALVSRHRPNGGQGASHDRARPDPPVGAGRSAADVTG